MNLDNSSLLNKMTCTASLNCCAQNQLNPQCKFKNKANLKATFTFLTEKVKKNFHLQQHQFCHQDPNVAARFSSQSSFLQQSQPREFSPQTIEITVPLTDEHKVDILCIEQLRVEEAPSMSFTQFCLFKGLTVEMIANFLDFDYPLKYKRGITKTPVEIIEAVQCWQRTFKKHHEHFDYWFHYTKHAALISQSIKHNQAIREAIQ